MIERIIDWCAHNRFVVLLFYAIVVVWGVWAMWTTPMDAIPDLSENQVIIYTEWMGRAPQLIEDQITFPLVTALQGVPGVSAVRATSMFGMSFVYVIFDDATDLYWARSRVSEKLSTVQSSLPAGSKMQLGPDGTGVGHVFWYTVEGAEDLGMLRMVQDCYIQLNLQSVRGVAEVASVGGYVRQYQVDVNPAQLKSYGLSIAQVRQAVMRANNDVGGKIIESGDAEYFVRGEGYIHSIRDLEMAVVSPGENGTPVLISNVATVQLGPDIRRGALEKNGTGQVVGGIVVMRSGENAKDVIERVKEKLRDIATGLPPGVKIVPAYDRSDLIARAVDTLKHALWEEAIVVSIMVLIFLLHVRSVIRVIIEIPVAVLIAFIGMRSFGITSNIMSLGGIAIAIGVIVDASIVLVENAYRNVARLQEKQGTLTSEDYVRVSIASAKQVGPAIFFSVAIMVVSFLPVFLLEGQEGKLFHPLAYTKTFVLAGSAIIAITLVPVLMTLLTRGKFRTEQRNPVTRLLIKLYMPVIRWALEWRKTAIALNVVALLITIPILLHIGSEFMPPLDEGSLLFMPIMLPDVSIEEAQRVLQVQDALIKSVPEVDQVLGKVGRAETSTDPAPVSMIETIITLKPHDKWRPGVTQDGLIDSLNAKLRIPGVRNGWTQPIINRINMLSTGVRTDLGIKIFGASLDTLEQLAIQAEGIVRTVPGAADVYAERTQSGRFIDVKLNRNALARYGLSVGDVEDIIETAIGGENIGVVIDGRKRFPIRVRYQREWRDNIDALKAILVPTKVAVSGSTDAGGGDMGQATSDGGMGDPSDRSYPTDKIQPAPSAQVSSRGYIPLSQVANIEITAGPPMISSENAQLRSIVFLNVRGRDMGGFVEQAKTELNAKMKLPAGYSVSWSGQWENQVRAKNRLMILMPIVFLIIFVMLYFTTKSFVEAGVVMLSVPFALIGGVYLISILHYNFSVAVWVGFIALYGLAVETGVVMVVYLHESLDRKLHAVSEGTRGPMTREDVIDATVEGAALRLRPKIMTVATALIGLIPIMWSTGAGADVMKPIAAPIIGGLITSAIHVLIVTPILFSWMKESALRRGTLKVSRMAEFTKE